MITILESTYRGATSAVVEARRSGKSFSDLEYAEYGHEVRLSLKDYFADPANQHKKVEVVLMSAEDAQRVRFYWQNIHEGGHHA
jgi:hypothetical protein